MPPTQPTEDVENDAAEPTAAAGPARRQSRWVTIFLPALGVFLIVVAVAGYFIELPYVTVSPGEALDVNDRVTVDGAETYTPEGDLMLLFVRQSQNVNVWRYVMAELDPDVDLEKEEEFTQGQTQEELRVSSDTDMAFAQLSAKKLALETAGYDVETGDGVVVLGVFPSLPAGSVLQADDVILSVDGQPIKEAAELGEIVRTHEPGDTVTLEIQRTGKPETVEVAVAANEEGIPVIGVVVAPRYDFPVDINIDTSNIGGPSAGLAMTLGVIDTLTPGELTGGQKIAITGTIREDGSVGEIGGLSQKTVAARSAGAELFIVPECGDQAATSPCMVELERARRRAGDLEVVPVATLDEALCALVAAGGEPVENGPNSCDQAGSST